MFKLARHQITCKRLARQNNGALELALIGNESAPFCSGTYLGLVGFSDFFRFGFVIIRREVVRLLLVGLLLLFVILHVRVFFGLLLRRLLGSFLFLARSALLEEGADLELVLLLALLLLGRLAQELVSELLLGINLVGGLRRDYLRWLLGDALH